MTATELHQQLSAARQWLKVFIDEMDIDPADTSITISAVGPEGKRAMVAVTLERSLSEIDRALAEFKP